MMPLAGMPVVEPPIAIMPVSVVVVPARDGDDRQGEIWRMTNALSSTLAKI
jgi:hypothetical protein